MGTIAHGNHGTLGKGFWIAKDKKKTGSSVGCRGCLTTTAETRLVRSVGTVASAASEGTASTASEGSNSSQPRRIAAARRQASSPWAWASEFLAAGPVGSAPSCFETLGPDPAWRRPKAEKRQSRNKGDSSRKKKPPASSG
ncbi:hypothetical protein CCUS01_11927 [Colletotrichum cuscutae]|uniref:Uncharacterized protein n=1 Tax=Colletotrichum cuscutae TaxID=1209917 RepID=A0AAI9U1U0_9PEZI|nr:hypothetical protein CCUS01_11927 [Colletotrichum cuscutae]